MSRTRRWWHKHKNYMRLNERYRWFIDNYPNINPFYFRHDYKLVRIKIHRSVRRLNKIRLQKGREVEEETKTNGWETH